MGEKFARLALIAPLYALERLVLRLNVLSSRLNVLSSALFHGKVHGVVVREIAKRIPSDELGG